MTSFDLKGIASGGLAAVLLTQWITQALKKVLELWLPPTHPAHDAAVQWLSIVVSITIVEIATFAVGPDAIPGVRHQGVAAAFVAAAIGLAITFGAQGSFKFLVGSKVDPPTVHILPPTAGEPITPTPPTA